MADEANTQAAEETQAASAEQTAGDSQTQEQTTQSETTSQDASQSGSSETKADASTGDKSKSENKDAKQEFKPVSRRSAAYRIQQLTKQVKDLKGGQQNSQQQDDTGDEDAGDDTPQPDISALVAQEVERRLNPVMSEHSKAADDSEISELFTGDRASQRAEYEPKIRELWKLDQYKDVAAQGLHAMLVGRSIDSIVAKAVEAALTQAKEADKEAKESSASGSSNTSNRTGKNGKSVWEMSSEEFQKQNEQVKANL